MGECIKFTTERLAALKPPAKGEATIRDTDSPLAVRLQAAGARAFYIVRYRLPGQKDAKRITLGAVGQMSLKAARAQASAYVVAAKQGSDPAATRKAAAAGDGGPTLGELVTAYEMAQRAKGIARLSEDMATLNSAFAPLMNTPAISLHRADYVKILKKIRAATPAKAKRAQTLIHGVLALAQNDGAMENNVMGGYRAPAQSKKQKAQADEEKAGLALTMAETAALWRACDDKAAGNFGLYVQFVVLTGVRRIEATLAERSWFHAATKEEPAFIRIPARVAKNGRSHDVFLPAEFAIKLKAYLATHNHKWLFPGGVSRKTGNIAAMTGWSKRWPKMRAIANKYGLLREEVTLHDLRRTLRTQYEAMGVSPRVAERQINHISNDKLDAAYNRHDYRQERIAAADLWLAAINAAVGEAS